MAVGSPSPSLTWIILVFIVLRLHSKRAAPILLVRHGYK